jgi:dTDP-glucose 4,6-dehydratase
VNVLVTGGAGFIGSAFVRHLRTHCADLRVVTLDKLTYAGNLENLAAVAGDPSHRFLRGDICDPVTVTSILTEERIDSIVHFAAESHVDRSILSPRQAVETNVGGTAVLLEAARATGVSCFLLVSTDEVYGSIDEPFAADENFPLNPSSPYAASKAASELLALSYFRTFRLPVVITRASNNFGPYQFPEKLIPLMISNALEGMPLPIYGDGLQVRDWLFVDDHCRALTAVLRRGCAGEIYNIGGNCSLPNREVVRRILDIVGAPQTLITTVADRPGHDRRYALRSDKIARQLGVAPQTTFEDGLAATVAWYRNNPGWIHRVKSGEYRDFYAKNYDWRGAPSQAVSTSASAVPVAPTSSTRF